MYAPEDPRVSILRDFGMVDAPAVADAIKPGEFYGTVSAEQAADLDSDVFLTWVDSPDNVETIENDKLLGQIPAIAEGHWYAETDKQNAMASTNPTPLSIPVIVSDFLPHVVEAIEGSMTALVPTRDDVSRAPGGGQRRRPALPASVAISIVALAGAGALSLLVGARAVPLAAVWDAAHPMHAVVEARLDRTLLGLAVGAALGLAGAVMQGLTRNPLADPGILGVNAGATFAMVVGMTVFGFSGMGQFLPLAFVGAAVAAAAVHGIASLGRDGATPMKLAITGAALSAGLASWTTGLLLADRKTMETFRFWQVGTVARARASTCSSPGCRSCVLGAAAGARRRAPAQHPRARRRPGPRPGPPDHPRPARDRARHRPARRHGDRAGRADRLRRPRRAPRRTRPRRPRPPPACCRSRCSAAPSSSSSPTRSAASCCRRRRCRSASWPPSSASPSSSP